MAVINKVKMPKEQKKAFIFNNVIAKLNYVMKSLPVKTHHEEREMLNSSKRYLQRLVKEEYRQSVKTKPISV